MSKETYSTTERLSTQARGRLASVSGGGILSGVVFLSGALSALFFWQKSDLVFVNVWPPLALVLGLVVGLLPSEGAFFGWKAVRGTKTDMTSSQVKATRTGLVTAVITSGFSTFALFVASFPSVPIEIREHSDWFVFLALSLPVILQTAIYAHFAVNERGVVENQKRAELSALGFDAFIRNEQARIQSIINGMDAALDKQLEAYGRNIGEQEANQLLNDGGQQLLGMGKQATEDPQPTRHTYARADNGILKPSKKYGLSRKGHMVDESDDIEVLIRNPAYDFDAYIVDRNGAVIEDLDRERATRPTQAPTGANGRSSEGYNYPKR